MTNKKRNINVSCATNKKEYMKQYSHIWYLENRAKKLGVSVDQYQKNRRHLLDLRHKRYLSQKTELAKRNHKEYYEIKKEIFYLLSGKCANPFNLPHPDWCNDIECLQIDHIHGGGLKELKKFSNAREMYRFILKQIKSGSKNYQLLCANCNQKKRFKNKEGIKYGI